MYPFDIPDQPTSLLKKQSQDEKKDIKSELVATIKGISLPKLIEKIVLLGGMHRIIA